MAFNPFLNTELAAKRAANREKYLEYLAQAKHIQSLPGEVISADDLAKWGRESSADNAILPQVEQSVIRFGERTPRENVRVARLAQPQPTTVFKGKLNNEVVNTNYFPASVEANRLQPGDRVGVYRDAYHDPNTGELVSPAAICYANVTGYSGDIANNGLPIKFVRGKSTPFESLMPEQQAFALGKINPTNNKEELTDGLNQFFKPSAIGWGTSPVPKQGGSLPFIKSNLSNPRYSDATMAGIDKVLIGDEYRDVRWVNQGKQNGNAQPYIFDKNSSVPIHLSEVLSPQQYQDVMAGVNTPLFLNKESPFTRFLNKNNPNDYDITDSGNFKQVQGRVISDGESSLPNQGEMWGIGQELNDINKAQEDALRTRSIDSIPVYRGSNDENGLNKIDAVAQAGGSGTWVNDNVESHINPFRSSNQTRSAAMAAEDLARGGIWQSGKNQPSSALPGVTQEDFIGDRMAYSERGYPVDVQGTRYIPKGVTALTPASEFLEPAAQWKFQPQRETLQFPTTPETPLTLAAVNDYGIAKYPGNPDNAYTFPDEYQGKRVAALSVQRNNGTLDPTQLSSRGRWMGGGLAPDRKYGRNDRTDDNKNNGFFYNPLESQYLQIQKPPGSDYLRLRSDTDPLTLKAIAADTAARKAAADYQEPAQVNPFTRQYKINQTGNEIAGVIPSGQIQGVTLPVMVEQKVKGGTKFEPDYMPYAPSLAPINQPIGDGLTLLDQHLADARITIDGARYPLTPEATAVEYLPSESQLNAEKTRLHGKTRVGLDNKVQWWNGDGPSDAELTSIANDGNLNFNPADDIRQIRRSGKGLAPAYADPSIAPTDIVSAIEAKQQELNRNRALITNYAGSSRLRSQEEIDAIKAQYPRVAGLGKTYAIGDTVPIDRINYPASSTANTGVYRDISSIGNIVITRDSEGFVVSRRPASDFVKRKKVTDIDGNTYFEDVDTVNQKDLADIFDAPRAMTVPELQQRAAYLQNEIENATNAHNQLMGMEAAPEIQITINGMGKRRAANLSEQMQQIGFALQDNDERQVIATGSLPIGLPFERSVNLPVKYNSQEVIDPEVQALVDQNKADTVAAQRLINYNQYYKEQQQRNQILNQVGRPQLKQQVTAQPIDPPALRPKPLLVPASSEAALSQILETPPADTAARRSFNAARVGTGRDTRILYGQNKVRNGDDFISNAGNIYPEYAQALNIDFQPTQSNFYDELFAPNVTTLHSTPTGFAEPQYQTADNFIAQSPMINDQSTTLNTQYQIPNWALPAAGGVYLAAAGVNEYQRQQEAKRQQDEAGLRRLYMG